MPTKYLTLKEAVSMIEAMIDEGEVEEEDAIDIVELPPEAVDNLTDTEDVDENELGVQKNLGDTAGSVEVHSSADGTHIPDSSNNHPAAKRIKIHYKWLKPLQRI